MAKNKGGRPTTYTIELATKICSRIAEGESLREVCRDDKMPNRSTVHLWLLDANRKEFSDQYEKACNVRAENMFDELTAIADDGTNDSLTRTNGDGTEYEVQNTEYIQRSRLRVDVRKWYLSKIMPKKYGEKVDVTTDGKALPGVTITGMQVIKDNGDTIQDKKS